MMGKGLIAGLIPGPASCGGLVGIATAQNADVAAEDYHPSAFSTLDDPRNIPLPSDKSFNRHITPIANGEENR